MKTKNAVILTLTNGILSGLGRGTEVTPITKLLAAVFIDRGIPRASSWTFWNTKQDNDTEEIVFNQAIYVCPKDNEETEYFLITPR